MSIFLRELLKKDTLTDKLFSIIDDYDIYCGLIGRDIELGETLCSPIRSSDDYPSFALFVPTKIKDLRPEAVWFKDLADGRSGDVFKFVKYFALHNFGIELNSRYEAIKFIDSQLKLGLFENNFELPKISVERDFSKHRTLKDIHFKSRKFTARDLQYWKELCLDEEDLTRFNVRSVRYLLDENGIVRREFRRSELVFVYLFWDKLKLYQPEAPKSFKFRNTCPGDDYYYYQGFEQLVGAPRLIITKSYKDVMVFWKFFNIFMNIKVDVIAPHAESINLNQKFVDGIKLNYGDNIFCVSDYDLAGVKFANQCKRHGFKYKFISTQRFLINGKLKVVDKDISDYLSNHGKDKTIKLLSSWHIEK